MCMCVSVAILAQDPSAGPAGRCRADGGLISGARASPGMAPRAGAWAAPLAALAACGAAQSARVGRIDDELWTRPVETVRLYGPAGAARCELPRLDARGLTWEEYVCIYIYIYIYIPELWCGPLWR